MCSQRTTQSECHLLVGRTGQLAYADPSKAGEAKGYLKGFHAFCFFTKVKDIRNFTFAVSSMKPVLSAMMPVITAPMNPVPRSSELFQNNFSLKILRTILLPRTHPQSPENQFSYPREQRNFWSRVTKTLKNPTAPPKQTAITTYVLLVRSFFML